MANDIIAVPIVLIKRFIIGLILTFISMQICVLSYSRGVRIHNFVQSYFVFSECHFLQICLWLDHRIFSWIIFFLSILIIIGRVPNWLKDIICILRLGWYCCRHNKRFRLVCILWFVSNFNSTFAASLNFPYFSRSIKKLLILFH